LRASEPDPGALSSVVLAAGRGRRFAELGTRWPKALLPILGRPLVRWQLDALAEAGVSETVVVVGHQAERLVEELGRGAGGLRLRWIPQAEPRGIADALEHAAPELARPFLCLLGDVHFEAPDLARVARGLEGADAALGVCREEDPREVARNFEVELDAEGWVRAVEEKPRAPRGAWKGVGLYAFRPEFLACVRATTPSALRNERELTDAVQRYLAGGARVRAVPLTGPDFNLSEPVDLLAANLHELARAGRTSWVDPEAHVEEDVALVRSIVLAGARVTRGARLERVLVFPGERVPAGVYDSALFVAGRVVACPPRA